MTRRALPVCDPKLLVDSGGSERAASTAERPDLRGRAVLRLVGPTLPFLLLVPGGPECLAGVAAVAVGVSFLVAYFGVAWLVLSTFRALVSALFDRGANQDASSEAVRLRKIELRTGAPAWMSDPAGRPVMTR